MGKSFSACEIVELAVQIEKNGREFYAALIGLEEDPEAKKVFKYLADAEDKHISIFEGIFKDSCSYSGGNYPDEYFDFMNSLASNHVFTQANKGAEIAKNVKTFDEAIELAIGFEKDSILFYEEMKRLVPEEDRKVIDSVIAEERSHFERLCAFKGGN